MHSLRAESIDHYIASFPGDVQPILRRMRNTIRKAAPGAVEKISYGIPTFWLEGNLVHFAAYKQHIGFYPGSSAISVFRKKLSGFEVSKGTIRFPLDRPVPYALITAIVKHRVTANQERSAMKRKRS
jgi:uncharacterized protein YdhG (YjbR/CyaY superfamily)